jgi:hypothetical protein
MFDNRIAGELSVPLNCGYHVHEGSLRGKQSGRLEVPRGAFRALVRFAAVILFGSLVSGCLATLQGDPDRLYPVQYETDAARQLLPYLEQRYYDPAISESERLATRNDIIARRMYIIDAQYSVYEAALTREHQEVNFAADAASLGLNTAGTLVTPASTTRLLGGIAGGIIGIKGNYESDIVIAKTVQIIQAQMRANRDIVAARLLRNMGQSTSAYPLSLALTDLEDYYRAGTLTAGLIKAADIVGANAQKVEAIKPDTVILDTTYSRDQATDVLRKFLYPNGTSGGVNKAHATLLNTLLADTSRFSPNPAGVPWRYSQILVGSEVAGIRLQLARAAGLLP